MKLRFQSVVFILILFGVIFASCENPWMEDILDPLLNPTVTFVSNGGSLIEPLKVERGSKIDAPQDPERSGFNFGGWYTEQELVNLVEFPYIVTKSVTLFAMWDYVNIDYRISLSITGTHPFASRKTGETPPDAQTITVTNTGLNATGTLNIALSGANASSFTLSRSSLDSIDPESTDIFTIRPNSDLGEGTYTASVRVSGGNGISASFNVSFTVEPSILGISLTAQNLSGGLYTFSNVEVGGSATAVTVTVTNTGNQPTGELTIELSGANPESFALSPSTLTSLNPGAQNTFTVAPNDGLDVGTYTAVVTVSNGSDIEESFNVSFTVLAGTYGISISASGLTAENAYTFPAGVYQGDVPSALLVTVTNTQGQNTGELSIALTGTNPTSFTLLDGSALASINPGNNGTFRIVPTGSIAGTYSATVTITGANNISASFTVSFTVNPRPILTASVIMEGELEVGRAHSTIPIYASTTGYSADSTTVSWSRADGAPMDAVFHGGVAYTVAVPLTANTNYTFTGGLTEAVTIGVNDATVSNNTGSTATISYTFAALARPVISIDPHPQSVDDLVAGSISGSLTTAASVSSPAEVLTYQWYSNTSASNEGGTPIGEPSLTATTFTIPTDLPAGDNVNNFYFFCEVTASLGALPVRTNVATVSVNAKVNAQQPTDVRIVSSTYDPNVPIEPVDGTTTLNATGSVTDDGELSYQWYTTNSSTNNTTGTAIDEATNSSYLVRGLTSRNNYYYVVVTNKIDDNGDGGTKTASATSLPFLVQVNVPVVNVPNPVIITPPASVTIENNTSATLTVETEPVTADVTQTYRWYIYEGDSVWAVIAGATSQSYTTDILTTGSYDYRVNVYNEIEDNGDTGQKSVGVTSQTATVTVNPEPIYSISLEDTNTGTLLTSQTYTFDPDAYGYTVRPTLRATIKNTGNQGTGELSVELSGDDASSFSFSDLGNIYNIAIDGSIEFYVAPITGLSARTYTATVTVSSATNGITASFNVSFTVEKTDPTVTFPSSATLTYGQKLIQASLSSGNISTYAWELPDLEPTVAQSGSSFKMIFTPTDTVNYNTLTRDVPVTVNPQPLTGPAAITVASGTAPAKDATPSAMISMAPVNFSSSALVWKLGGATFEGNFLANRAYTVEVTLTANLNYTFPSTFAATINGQDADVAITDAGGSGGHQNKITVSYTFPATERAVITITTQPEATTTVTAGSINETLTAAATIDGGATLRHRWYRGDNATSPSGTQVQESETNTPFVIPKDLAPGTYYYFYEALSSDAAPGSVFSNIATVIVQQSASFEITYKHIEDGTDDIEGIPDLITISPTGAGGAQTARITLVLPPLPDGITYGEITWEIPGTTVTGSGTTFDLNASDYNAIGTNLELVLLVWIGDQPFSKSIPFRVVP